MKKSILVISYVANYNRQGYDIAECLRNAGCNVRLYQKDGETNREKKNYGVRCVKPHGFFHKFHMIKNLWSFFWRTVFVKKSIVICVGKPMLLLGGLYKLVFGSKLIWYSLEYSKLGKIDRFIYKNCVSGYIDVEENRLDAIFKEYGEKKKSLVCYNMPHRYESLVEGGLLKKYLAENYGFSGNEKLFIYAGSYQKYSCLENIVTASKTLSGNTKLILMTYGLPEEIKDSSKNCIIVPPVHGDEFYRWLADADCALLPYESKDDFNVQNCSPQKIFDCYCVGVPYIASDRPIVKKVLGDYSVAGVICDFTKIESIKSAMDGFTLADNSLKTNMFKLHREKFNYNAMSDKICSLIDSL